MRRQTLMHEPRMVTPDPSHPDQPGLGVCGVCGLPVQRQRDEWKHRRR